MSGAAPPARGSGTSRWMRWLPETLYLSATTAFGLLGGGRWLSSEGDIGAWWSLTHRIASGARLYRDVYPELYGPLSPYLLAWAERIFGDSTSEFLLVNWVSGILAGGMLLWAARPLLTTLERCGLAGLVIATSVLSPGPGRLVYCYAPGAVQALFFSILALVFVGRQSPPKTRSAILAGFFAGVAFCCKQEIGAAAAVALWASVAVAGAGRARWLAATTGGFVASVLPAAAFALSSASPESLARDSHLWPLAMAPRGDWHSAFRRIAGLSSADWAVVVRSSAWTFLSLVVVATAACWILQKERRAGRWLPIVITAALLVAWWFLDPARLGATLHPITLSSAAAAAVLLAALILRIEHRALTVSVATFALIVSLRAVVSADAGGHYAGVAHLATSLTWAILVCVLIPRAIGGPGSGAVLPRRIFGVALLLVGWSGAASAGVALATTANEPYASPRGKVFVRSEAFFAALGRSLRPGERVLTLPEPYALEPLFGVRPWSKFLLLLPPMLAQSEARLLADLERDPPDAVVVFDRPTPEYGVAPFGKGYGLRIADWLETHFVVVTRVAGGALWRPKGTTPRPYNSRP